MSELVDRYTKTKEEAGILMGQVEEEFRRVFRVIQNYFMPIDRESNAKYSWERPSAKFLGTSYIHGHLEYFGVEDSIDGTEKVMVAGNSDGDSFRFPYVYMEMGEEEIYADIQARLDLEKTEKKLRRLEILRNEKNEEKLKNLRQKRKNGPNSSGFLRSMENQNEATRNF